MRDSPGPRAPPRGTSPSKTTRRPERIVTRTCSVVRLSSAAPTVSASRAPPGPEMLPVRCPRRPVVPGRCDNERVERERPGDGTGRRAVLEGGVGLGHADDRYLRGIQGVSVTVRVDSALEAGDQLVRAGVDGPAAREGLVASRRPGLGAASRSPPGRSAHPALRSRRRGRRAASRAARALGRLVGVGPRRGEIVVLEDVDPRIPGAGEVVVCVLDARVEERNRHAVAAVAGQPESGPGGRAGWQVVPLEQLAGGGCRGRRCGPDRRPRPRENAGGGRSRARRAERRSPRAPARS